MSGGLLTDDRYQVFGWSRRSPLFLESGYKLSVLIDFYHLLQKPLGFELQDGRTNNAWAQGSSAQPLDQRYRPDAE